MMEVAFCRRPTASPLRAGWFEDHDPDLENDVGVVSIPNLLVAHADMDEKLVYEITRALFENRADLVAIHPEAQNLTLESAVRESPAPFHPGAIRYYKEQHVWPE
jgi:TRAP transporter TAXI family solute receptor